MKKPFSVGERVRAYGGNQGQTGYFKGQAGIIKHIPDQGDWINVAISLSAGTTETFTFHPKQCRRLIPKKKKWVWMYQPLRTIDDGQIIESDYLFQTKEKMSEYHFKVSGYRKVKVHLKEEAK